MMEAFRKKVERRFRINVLVCLCAGGLFCLLEFLTQGAGDFAQGLTLGVFSGLEVVAVYHIAASLAALRNEAKLKAMYINETDERNIAIAKETSQKGAKISTLGISVAAIVAGFFDEKVCISLVAAMLFSALVTIIVNAYYKRNM